MPNAAQADYWNGDVGRLWLAQERRLDALTSEVAALLLGRGKPEPGDQVLEVGCGGGGLSLRTAQAVAPGGSVLGLDISGPLLARAEARRDEAGISNLDFQQADAQVAPLPEATFDLILSHFGAMFFEDPVAAFTNLRAALRPGGRMVLAAWGPLAANPFFTLAREAAIARVGPPTDVTPAGAPGPFAFADPAPVLEILQSAGFAHPRADAVTLTLRPPGGPQDVADLATTIGPAVRILATAGATDEDRTAVRESLAKGYAAYALGDGLAIPTVINLFEAQR